MTSVINTTSILQQGLICTDLPVGPLVLGHAGVSSLALGCARRLQGRELVLQLLVLPPHLIQLLQPRPVLALLLLTQVLNHSLLGGKRNREAKGGNEKKEEKVEFGEMQKRHLHR